MSLQDTTRQRTTDRCIVMTARKRTHEDVRRSDMESQNRRILEHLQAGKSITPLEAIPLFGCYRLSARIKDLRKKGFEIETDMVSHVNSNGEKKRYARYYM